MKIFVAHSTRDRDLVASLVTLLREDGHDVFVPMEKIMTGNLLSEISAAIRSADVFVALVTSGNPNVFYELGLASGAGVTILVTAPAGELLPADLVSVPYVQLTGDIIRDAQTIARGRTSLRVCQQRSQPNQSPLKLFSVQRLRTRQSWKPLAPPILND